MADQIRIQLVAGLGIQGMLKALSKLPVTQTRRQRYVARIEAHKARLAELRAKRRRFYESYAHGQVSLADFENNKRATESFIVDAENALEAAENKLKDFDALFAVDEAFLQVTEAIEDIDTFSEELLRAMVKRVDVSAAGTIHITFRFGDWIERAMRIRKVIS